MGIATDETKTFVNIVLHLPPEPPRLDHNKDLISFLQFHYSDSCDGNCSEEPNTRLVYDSNGEVAQSINGLI